MSGLRIEHYDFTSTVASLAVHLVEHCLTGLLRTDVVHKDKALNDERVNDGIQEANEVAGPIHADC